MKSISTTIILILIGSFAAIAQQYETLLDVAYYENKTDAYLSERCRLDLYYPKDINNYATVVWFHGGGIQGGNKEIPRQLLDKGFAVVGVGYRLSPKVKAPAYLQDAAAAIAWVMKNISRYGGSEKRIYLSGHSAGAYLTTMVTFDKSYLASHDLDANKIAGLIAFSGQAITHFTVRQEMGINETQPIVDKYAPLFHVRKDLPPTILITGDRELEMLGRYEENAYLYRMLKIVGAENVRFYELDGFNHNTMANPSFDLLIQEVTKAK